MTVSEYCGLTIIFVHLKLYKYMYRLRQFVKNYLDGSNKYFDFKPTSEEACKTYALNRGLKYFKSSIKCLHLEQLSFWLLLLRIKFLI